MPVKINVKKKGAKKAKKWVMPVVSAKASKKASVQKKIVPAKKEEKRKEKIAAPKKSTPAPVKKAPAQAKKIVPVSSPKVSAKTIAKLTQKPKEKKIEKAPEKKREASEKKELEEEIEGILSESEKEEKEECDSSKKNLFCQDEEKEPEGEEEKVEREIEEGFSGEKEAEKEESKEESGKEEVKEEPEEEKKEEKTERDENQISLTDFTNPEDVNKFFLDISTETEKGEPESNLEALVAAAKSKLPGDIKERCVIEAALFMSAKPLSIPDLAKLTGIAAIGYVENEVKALAAEYEQRGSAIVVANEEGKYVMRLKPAYLQFVKEFAQEGELSRLALKVLAYVAKNEGILKSTLVKRIGTTVYEGVGELVEKGFVEQRKSGRSSSLRTTAKFKEYFSQ